MEEVKIDDEHLKCLGDSRGLFVTVKSRDVTKIENFNLGPIRIRIAGFGCGRWFCGILHGWQSGRRRDHDAWLDPVALFIGTMG